MHIKKSIKRAIPKRYHHSILWFKTGVKAIWRVGFKVKCPCCGWSFREFAEVDYSAGEKISCPRCYSLQRSRLLWPYLKDRTDLFSRPKRVLHFAPEFHLRHFLLSMKSIEYVGVDYSWPGADIKVDMVNLPFKEGAFDVIICSHVLEHIQNDLAATKELYRVLAPGGWSILQVPLDKKLEKTFEDPAITTEEDRLRVYGHIDHKRNYGRDYADRLASAGFRVTADDYSKSFDENAKRKYGLPDEDIYFCVKEK